MSNDERGRKLLAAAQEYLDEMSAALARDSWNITVRHAQEVVELAVKGVLCYLGVRGPLNEHYSIWTSRWSKTFSSLSMVFRVGLDLAGFSIR